MDSKAFFFRHMLNLKELKEKTRMKLDLSATPSTYTIIGEIPLGYNEFITFCNDFTRNFPPMYPFIYKMSINESSTWNCILISNVHSNESVLVFTNGYSYPRFTAIKL